MSSYTQEQPATAKTAKLSEQAECDTVAVGAGAQVLTDAELDSVAGGGDDKRIVWCPGCRNPIMMKVINGKLKHAPCPICNERL